MLGKLWNWMKGMYFGRKISKKDLDLVILGESHVSEYDYLIEQGLIGSVSPSYLLFEGVPEDGLESVENDIKPRFEKLVDLCEERGCEILPCDDDEARQAYQEILIKAFTEDTADYIHNIIKEYEVVDVTEDLDSNAKRENVADRMFDHYLERTVEEVQGEEIEDGEVSEKVKLTDQGDLIDELKEQRRSIHGEYKEEVRKRMDKYVYDLYQNSSKVELSDYVSYLVYGVMDSEDRGGLMDRLDMEREVEMAESAIDTTRKSEGPVVMVIGKDHADSEYLVDELEKEGINYETILLSSKDIDLEGAMGYGANLYSDE